MQKLRFCDCNVLLGSKLCCVVGVVGNLLLFVKKKEVLCLVFFLPLGLQISKKKVWPQAIFYSGGW